MKKKMKFAEYDRMEETCDRIRAIIDNEDVTNKRYYDAFTRWPRKDTMKELQVEENFDTFFPYLFFWYTQKLEPEKTDDPAEYKLSMDYIRKLMERNIEFED